MVCIYPNLCSNISNLKVEVGKHNSSMCKNIQCEKEDELQDPSYTTNNIVFLEPGWVAVAPLRLLRGDLLVLEDPGEIDTEDDDIDIDEEGVDQMDANSDISVFGSSDFNYPHFSLSKAHFKTFVALSLHLSYTLCMSFIFLMVSGRNFVTTT